MLSSNDRNKELNLHTSPAVVLSENTKSNQSGVLKSENLVHAEKTLARHASDMRKMAVINDKLEFRRLQAELRACGASTGFGAMHILNHRLSDGVSKTLRERR